MPKASAGIGLTLFSFFACMNSFTELIPKTNDTMEQDTLTPVNSSVKMLIGMQGNATPDITNRIN